MSGLKFTRLIESDEATASRCERPVRSSDNPRIVYLANARSVFTIRWANFFASRGWEVHIVSWRSLDVVANLHPGVKVWRIGSPPVHGFRWLALGEIMLHLLRLRPDIIHGHYLRTFGTLAGLTTYVMRTCPVVVSAWGPHGLLTCKHPLRHLVRVAVARADAVTASTHHLAGILADNYEVPQHKLECFSWGVDTSLFTPRPGVSSAQSLELCRSNGSLPLVFSPRTAARHYRIDVVVHAISLLHGSGSPVSLVVAAGAGAERKYVSRIRGIVRDSGLCTAVAIIDRTLSTEEMAHLYRHATAAVSIPIDDQFGASVLEAMACGSVPIVSCLPAYRQYLTHGDNALYVSGQDPEELADAIRRALTDAPLQQRCASMNPAIVFEHEDWHRNALQMEQVYLRLIQSFRP